MCNYAMSPHVHWLVGFLKGRDFLALSYSYQSTCLVLKLYNFLNTGSYLTFINLNWILDFRTEKFSVKSMLIYIHYSMPPKKSFHFPLFYHCICTFWKKTRNFKGVLTNSRKLKRPNNLMFINSKLPMSTSPPSFIAPIRHTFGIPMCKH